ncbi:hypothetical protein I312_105052 [Cryptococcus bacillisporus CA1280]|uniref:26S protease regulatory subunit 7 n=1 Tax=Cryptococcus decagattii TaxID=1859122 RepID=A0ABZ2AUR8_9TREE
MAPKADWEKYDKKVTDEKEEKIVALDESDIQILKTYGQGPYSLHLKKIENQIKDIQKRVNEKMGVRESDTGLAPANLWDIPADKQRSGRPLQVARCQTIIKAANPPSGDQPLNPQDGAGAGNPEGDRYVISIKQVAKFVVGLGDEVSPTDVEEGMRVGVDQVTYKIMLPLPPKIDPSVTMMQVEERPSITYADVGGCKEQIEKLREVVELPLLEPERFVSLGIEPPKGVLLYGPPGTVDAIGGARFDDGAGGDNEVQRTMLELINQLDGFDPRGNIKVIMATNRPDTLDPALLRPGRLDRKVEFSLPDNEGRTHILKIHGKSMSVERDIRYDLIARLCPNATGAELKAVATEAGMFAIRARRKVATERDFLDAVEKVIRQGSKFSSTALYAQYN